MKRLFLIMVLFLFACIPPEEARKENETFLKDHIDSVGCAWSKKYEACFCGFHYDRSFPITWAPDKVCGK